MKVKVENVTKKFKEKTALKNITFEVKDREVFGILGYPGAGKSTLLRIIAGLEKQDSGEIYIGDQPMSNIYPGDRNIAMMFQNLALYPNRTVSDNLAFPLRLVNTQKEEIKRRVNEISKTLHIEHLLTRTPATLSGGERQRVALGRALIRRPQLFLLDEPLTNLDAKLRVEMRAELRRLQMELNQTIIVSTPDQLEAMSMSDRIAILREGELQQVATPDEIYSRPSNKFVAGFIGSPPMNFINCTFEGDGGPYLNIGATKINVSQYQELIRKQASGSELILGFRPEDVKVKDKKTKPDDIETTLYLRELLGSKRILHLEFGNIVLKVFAPIEFEADFGSKVFIELDPDRLCILDRKTEKTLTS